MQVKVRLIVFIDFVRMKNSEIRHAFQTHVRFQFLVVAIGKQFSMIKKSEFTIISIEPGSPAGIFFKVENRVFRKSVLYVIGSELVAIKPCQSMVGCKPNVTLFILSYTVNF